MRSVLLRVILLALLPAQSFGTGSYDRELVTKNAFRVLSRIGPKSHPEFMPDFKTIGDFIILRSEKSGIVDFKYTSSNGRFQGNLYCHLAQLLAYSDKYSNDGDVCFRLNIYEKDAAAVNGFGKQVGIY